MRIIHLLAAGAATIAVAVPAAAQSPYPYAYPQQAYPQYQYPQGYGQQGYGYPGQQGHGQNVVGQIINQLLGNRYHVSDRTAVTQCATAAMAQASAQYRPRGYPQAYGQNYGHGYGYGYGYPGYKQGYNPAMRVTAVTDVRRQSRGLRVSGLMSSGMHAGYPPYGRAYGYHHQAQSDLTFRCNVAYNGQVTNLRIGRTNQYRRY